MDGLDFAPAGAVAPALLHEAVAAAFADYLTGPFQLAPAQWPQFLARQAVDLAPSRVALRGGRVVAFALVAPRPELRLWRLATMGALPQARGTGAAPALLDDFIARATAAGMAGVELECFEQNERALRLYRSRGFAPLHRLYGSTWPGDGAVPDDDAMAGVVETVGLEDAFGWIDAFGRERGDLPLQVTPPSLRALPVQLQAWRCGSAQLLFSAASAGTLNVQSLLDREPQQQGAQALAGALLRRHPAHRVSVPQLQRLDLGGAALERLGFQRHPLNQVLMRRSTQA